jgi:hypothetical protein
MVAFKFFLASEPGAFIKHIIFIDDGKDSGCCGGSRGPKEIFIDKCLETVCKKLYSTWNGNSELKRPEGFSKFS